MVGAGQIGPDICLHFAKVFADHDVRLVVVDIVEDALSAASTRIEKKVQQGFDSGAFTQEVAESILQSITYTTDYQKIGRSNIVIEAATEDEKIKRLIFEQVEQICDDECLFLSNSSHMRPEVIFKNVRNKSRCLVAHYFFPAERNRVVEIVPAEETDADIARMLMGFYESIGKVPITVKSSYGYAIDPIFEGLCQTAILCLEKRYGTVKEIDAVAAKALGLGVGPFTALNLTGGNPITDHGLNEMNAELMPWFKSPQVLRDAVKNHTAWDTADRGEEITVPPAKEAILRKQFLGAFFALSSYVIDLDIVDISDLNMASEMALVVNAPFSMMNDMGLEAVCRIVEDFCSEHSQFPFPKSLKNASEEGKWKLSDIVTAVKDNVAIVTIRRPKVLNALNLDLIEQLKSKLAQMDEDGGIIGTVITGFGNKAFVSGADIHMLASLKTPQDGYENARSFQKIFSYIETSQSR